MASRTNSRVIRQARTTWILGQKLDYIHDPSFDDPGAAAGILGPMPERPSPARTPRPPAGLDPYLASLYLDARLLGRDQEIDLFRKLNYLKFRAEGLRRAVDPRRPRASDLDAIERLLAEAQAVKNQIVRANLRLVVSIAKKRVTPYQDLHELVSDGNLSLIWAVEKFDIARGFRFSTYASRSIMKNFSRSIPDEKKRRDRFVTGSEEFFEFAADNRIDQSGAEREYRRNQETVRAMLSRLNDRERRILISRFGIGGVEELTLERLGKELGITKERVRQIEARAQRKLRNFAPAEGDPAAGSTWLPRCPSSSC